MQLAACGACQQLLQTLLQDYHGKGCCILNCHNSAEQSMNLLIMQAVLLSHAARAHQAGYSVLQGWCEVVLVCGQATWVLQQWQKLHSAMAHCHLSRTRAVRLQLLFLQNPSPAAWC
jgi:hypothetical protein